MKPMACMLAERRTAIQTLWMRCVLASLPQKKECVLNNGHHNPELLSQVQRKLAKGLVYNEG